MNSLSNSFNVHVIQGVQEGGHTPCLDRVGVPAECSLAIGQLRNACDLSMRLYSDTYPLYNCT